MDLETIAKAFGIGLGISVALLLIPYSVALVQWIASYGFTGLCIALGFSIAALYLVISEGKKVL